MHQAVRVIISGRVQGVSYRAWTVGTASGLGLKGWVRNRSNGTVEAVFHGEESKITAMIESCKKGPPAALVEKIESYHWKEDVADAPFTALPTL